MNRVFRKPMHQFEVPGMFEEQPYRVTVYDGAKSHIHNLADTLREGNLPEELFTLAIHIASVQANVLETNSGSSDVLLNLVLNGNMPSVFATLEDIYGLLSEIDVE